MEELYESYEFLEDLVLNLDNFSFPRPTYWPFPNASIHRELKEVAVVDCNTMQSFQYPFVTPSLHAQQAKDDGIDSHHHGPVLILGKLVPVNVGASSASVRIIVTDHCVIPSEDNATEPSLWVKDHEDAWYRLDGSFNSLFQSRGDQIAEMIQQCGLGNGSIPNYKIKVYNSQSSSDLLDALTKFSESRPSEDASCYIVQGYVDVNSSVLKIGVRLLQLELLWPRVGQESPPPVFLANKKYALSIPDQSYEVQVAAVADALFGSTSSYRKHKRVPHSEQYFTVTNYTLQYSSAIGKQCAIQGIRAAAVDHALILRGRLSPVPSAKGGGRKQNSSSDPELNIVAYVHDYYVDIEYEKASSKSKTLQMACSYFVMPQAGKYWFKLGSPHEQFALFCEPASYINKNFNWPADEPTDVWRRITDYEVVRGNDGQHCSIFQIREDSSNWMVCGNLLAPDTSRKLQIRMYPMNNSIDYGSPDKDVDDNAGLWVQAPEGVGWYKLHRPPADAYREMSAKDWALADTIMSFQRLVRKEEAKKTQSVVISSTCRDHECFGRKFSLCCGLFRLWEVSKRSFDLNLVRANSSTFRDHISAFVCFHQSRVFMETIDDSRRDETERKSFGEGASAVVEQSIAPKKAPPQDTADKDATKKRKRPTDSSDGGRDTAGVSKANKVSKTKGNSSVKSGPIFDDDDDDEDIDSSGSDDGDDSRDSDESVPKAKPKIAGTPSSVAVPQDPNARKSYKKAPADDSTKKSSSARLDKVEAPNPSVTGQKKRSYWDDDNNENPPDITSANAKVSGNKESDVNQAKPKEFQREAQGSKKDPVGAAATNVRSQTMVASTAGTSQPKLFRQDIGFSSLDLCRYCKGVTKLPTCPNANHKDGQKSDSSRLPAPFVDKSSLSIRQPANLGYRPQSVSVSGFGGPNKSGSSSPHNASSSVSTPAAPVNRPPLVTDILKSFASGPKSNAASQASKAASTSAPVAPISTIISAASPTAAALLADSANNTAGAVLPDTDMNHERKHYKHITEDAVLLPTVSVESLPATSPSASPNENFPPPSTLKGSEYLHTRDIFAPLIPKLPDVTALGMKQLRQFDASRLNSLKPGLFSEVVRIPHTALGSQDLNEYQVVSSDKDYGGIFLTEKKKADRVKKKSLFWGDCSDKGRINYYDDEVVASVEG